MSWRPVSTATNYVRSLRRRPDWLGVRLDRRLTAVKYVMRTLCMPLMHMRHLDFIYGNADMRAYQGRDARLLERHFHRYINLTWSRRERLRSLRQHYLFTLAALPRTLFQAIYVRGHAPLGDLRMKDGSPLKIALCPPIAMGCEGELCIQLSLADDRPVYRLIMTVIDKRPTLAIGCIQGPDGENSREIVRELTRQLHGLRPKQLLLYLAYAFARYYGIERIHAVSNAAHPLRRNGRKFEADYDAFWQEQKGTPVRHGWHQLPALLGRKAEADVPSQHRAAFRRREALRTEAERLLIDALGQAPARHSAYALAQGPISPRSFNNSRPEALWIS
ncbi:VirK/YbjX family protein [Dyella koreensis]|uniref:DUF535 family protein n=1 Tax=Dyella koreensis TaxID=311235 RepID=A0ABW8KBG7_9GAMM